jgi:hypothetical protein
MASAARDEALFRLDASRTARCDPNRQEFDSKIAVVGASTIMGYGRNVWRCRGSATAEAESVDRHA